VSAADLIWGARRYLTVAEDATLALAKQSKALWARQEALAAVRQVLVADLPSVGSAFAPHAKRPLSAMESLQLNVLTLKVGQGSGCQMGCIVRVSERLSEAPDWAARACTADSDAH